MTEEFDVIYEFDLFSNIGQAVVLLALGIGLEFLLRFLQRRAMAQKRPLAGLVADALRWQPLFWSILIAFAWLLASLSGVSVARRRGLGIVWGLLAVSVAIVAVRILAGWFKMLIATRPAADVSILSNLINGLAIVIVVIVGLYAFSVPVSLQLVTLGSGALGLSLALREPLSNLFAGVVLMVSGRLRPGDFVQLPSGEEGRIRDIGWDVTSIQQHRDSLIIVPNSRLNEAEIVNFDRPTHELVLEVDVRVGSDSDLDEVERVTNEVADGTLRDLFGGKPNTPSYIRYKELRDSDILLTAYVACLFADRDRVRHEFLKRLRRRYDKEGIEIPSPVRTLHTQPGEPFRVVVGDSRGSTSLEENVE